VVGTGGMLCLRTTDSVAVSHRPLPDEAMPQQQESRQLERAKLRDMFD
jgi:hypothetical protein